MEDIRLGPDVYGPSTYRPQPFVTPRVRERFERHGLGVPHLV